MLGKQPRELPQRIGFILLPRFSMIAFTAAVEPLRLANRVVGKALYAWPVFSLDGGPVVASNGLSLNPEGDLEAASKLDTIVLCGGIDVQKIAEKPLGPWLRRMDRRGADLGAICTAPYILARHGLLGDTPDTENDAGFIRVIAPSSPLGMSLVLPNGVRLEWHGDLGPEQLEAVVITEKKTTSIIRGARGAAIFDQT